MRTMSYSAMVVGHVLNRLALWMVGISLVAIMVIGTSTDASAERRVALVIGNSNYKVANISLLSPRNDAEDVSAALKSLGFEVVTAINATRRDMELKLREFARLAVHTDSALFFYAGNALHFQGRDYLMPTDAMLEDEISLRYEPIALDVVRDALDRSNGVKIITIDAFRKNPFAKSHSAAATRDHFPYIDKSKGSVIAFASAPDDVAQDGQGRNSPFTAALLNRLQEPGLEIGAVPPRRRGR